MALDQETRLSFNTPARVTNRFVIVPVSYGIRLAFAEAAPGEDKAFDFHSAVVGSVGTMEQLHQMLGKMLGDIKAAQQPKPPSSR